MASIKDVAERAGVSVATVSRAMNDSPLVSPDTRKRVMRAIHDLQYYPNAAARSLKSEVSLSVGFLVSDISNGFFINVAKAVEDGIGGRGYNIIMCSTDQNRERERSYLQTLMGKQVDGLILNTTGENDELIAQISHKIPVVLLERQVAHPEFAGDYIANDNATAIQMLTMHLLRRNHRRIGVINGPLHLSSARERFAAFVREMAKVGVVVDDQYPYRVDTDFSLLGGYTAAKQMLARPERPTALVVMNNMMAVGVYQYLRKAKIRVPEEISVVHYGDIANSDILYVQPTYTTFSAEQVGKKTVEMLFSRLENGMLPNRESIFVNELRKGNTTAEN